MDGTLAYKGIWKFVHSGGGKQPKLRGGESPFGYPERLTCPPFLVHS